MRSVTQRPSAVASRLTPRQQETLDLIARRQPIARREIAHTLKISPATCGQHLHVLHQLGLVDWIGTGNRTRWTLATLEAAPQPKGPIHPPQSLQAASVWDYAQRCAGV